MKVHWKPMETAPLDGLPVMLKLDSGKIVWAEWYYGLVGIDEKDCGGWHSVDEKHPESWSDGICWRVNADEKESDPPIGWTRN